MRRLLSRIVRGLFCMAGEHDVGFRQDWLEHEDGTRYGVRQVWYCRRCGRLVAEQTQVWD
jgi:hypothetical protein